MAKIMIVGILVVFCTLTIVHSKPDPKKKVVQLQVGGFCGAAAAPTGPGGSWQGIESDTEKVCPVGSSCRTSACNCDDLPDGTIMSHSWDSVKEERTCKRIGGQKCEETSQCVAGAACVEGICTCDKNDKEIICPETKQDIVIMN